MQPTTTTSPTARIQGDEIVLASPYSERNLTLTKSVAGFRWDKATRTWHWPAQPNLAVQIAEVWRGQGLRCDRAFLDLVQVGREQRTKAAAIQAAAEGHRNAEEPDPIPVTNKDGWPHQRRAFWFFREMPGGMLALDMGLGKSFVTLALIEDDRRRGNNDPVLILAPKSVLAAWGGARGRPGQFDQHLTGEEQSHYLILRLDSDHTAKAKAEQADRAWRQAHGEGKRLVVIVNYDTARQPAFAAWTLKQRWGIVALDESHKIKAPGGETSKFCAKLRSRTRRMFGLTGTPAPHNPLDVYAQMRAIDPSLFGTNHQKFQLRYARMGGFQGREVVGFQNEEELNRKFYSRAIRVTKAQAKEEGILQLPPVLPLIYRTFKLSPPARRLYETLATKLAAEVEDGKVTVANALVKLLRLAQITSGFIPVDLDSDQAEPATLQEIDGGKAAALEDFLESLDPSEPVVVFARFTHDLEVVHRAATALKRGSLELSGRRNDLSAWQTDTGANPILAVQEQAGGVGIDLTRSCIAFYFSKGFSLGNYDQTLARLDRPGQTRPVTYVHLMAEATVDEQIMRALDTRREVVESILGEMKGARQ